MAKIRTLRFVAHGFVGSGPERGVKCVTGDVGEFDVESAYFAALVEQYGEGAFEETDALGGPDHLAADLADVSAAVLKDVAKALGAVARKTRTGADAIAYLVGQPEADVRRAVSAALAATEAPVSDEGISEGDGEGDGEG